MSLYAAYGSNLDMDQMRERCPHSPMVATGWLEGWRLSFGGEEVGWEGSLATIVEQPECRVYVVVYDLTREDEKALDEIELAVTRLYAKISVRVQTLEEDLLAWTYVLDHYEGGLPSARYLGLMAEAAAKAGAPDDYVADLRTRPCR